MNFLDYRIEYKAKLPSEQYGRASHYKQVSVFGELWAIMKGAKIVRRY